MYDLSVRTVKCAHPTPTGDNVPIRELHAPAILKRKELKMKLASLVVLLVSIEHCKWTCYMPNSETVGNRDIHGKYSTLRISATLHVDLAPP